MAFRSLQIRRAGSRSSSTPIEFLYQKTLAPLSIWNSDILRNSRIHGLAVYGIRNFIGTVNRAAPIAGGSNHSEAINGRYDVIVVGGGHAGCEAALASARLGAETLLLTLNIDRIAWQMFQRMLLLTTWKGTYPLSLCIQPCNPAIGGPAKSQLVHEVDALGGEIGKAADRCYLQKRVLNISRGPAVWALRAQVDKRE